MNRKPPDLKITWITLKIIVSVCEVLNSSVTAGKAPYLVLDTSLTGVPSESVKTFSAALALPTVSASFGQEGDIK